MSSATAMPAQQIGGSLGTATFATIARTVPGDAAAAVRVREAAQAAQPASALVEVLADLAGEIRTSEEFANHLSFLLLDLTNPEFRQLTAYYAASVEAAIAEVLEAGRAAGELTLADRAGMPRAVHAAYNGALITWGMHRPNACSPADAVREQLRQLLAPRARD